MAKKKTAEKAENTAKKSGSSLGTIQGAENGPKTVAAANGFFTDPVGIYDGETADAAKAATEKAATAQKSGNESTVTGTVAKTPTVERESNADTAQKSDETGQEKAKTGAVLLSEAFKRAANNAASAYSDALASGEENKSAIIRGNAPEFKSFDKETDFEKKYGVTIPTGLNVEQSGKVRSIDNPYSTDVSDLQNAAAALKAMYLTGEADEGVLPIADEFSDTAKEYSSAYVKAYRKATDKSEREAIAKQFRKDNAEELYLKPVAEKALTEHFKSAEYGMSEDANENDYLNKITEIKSDRAKNGGGKLSAASKSKLYAIVSGYIEHGLFDKNKVITYLNDLKDGLPASDIEGIGFITGLSSYVRGTVTSSSPQDEPAGAANGFFTDPVGIYDEETKEKAKAAIDESLRYERAGAANGFFTDPVGIYDGETKEKAKAAIDESLRLRESEKDDYYKYIAPVIKTGRNYYFPEEADEEDYISAAAKLISDMSAKYISTGSGFSDEGKSQIYSVVTQFKAYVDGIKGDKNKRFALFNMANALEAVPNSVTDEDEKFLSLLRDNLDSAAEYVTAEKKLKKAEEKNVLEYQKTENGLMPVYRDKGFISANYSTGSLGITSDRMGSLYAKTGDKRFYNIAKMFQELSQGVAMQNYDDINPDNLLLDIAANGIQNLPQQIDTLAEGAKLAPIAGVAVLAGVPIGTVLKALYVSASAKSGLEIMRGEAMVSLTDMGLSYDDAKKLAGNEGFINALIESGDAVLDIVAFGAGKGLAKKAISFFTDKVPGAVARTASSALLKLGLSEEGVKLILKSASAAGAFTVDVLGEGAEEWLQSSVTMANEDAAEESKRKGSTEGENVLKLVSRAFTREYTPEEKKERNESFKGGVKGGIFFSAGHLTAGAVTQGLYTAAANKELSRAEGDSIIKNKLEDTVLAAAEGVTGEAENVGKQVKALRDRIIKAQEEGKDVSAEDWGRLSLLTGAANEKNAKESFKRSFYAAGKDSNLSFDDAKESIGHDITDFIGEDEAFLAYTKGKYEKSDSEKLSEKVEGDNARIDKNAEFGMRNSEETHHPVSFSGTEDGDGGRTEAVNPYDEGKDGRKTVRRKNPKASLNQARSAPVNDNAAQKGEFFKKGLTREELFSGTKKENVDEAKYYYLLGRMGDGIEKIYSEPYVGGVFTDEEKARAWSVGKNDRETSLKNAKSVSGLAMKDRATLLRASELPETTARAINALYRRLGVKLYIKDAVRNQSGQRVGGSADFSERTAYISHSAKHKNLKGAALTRYFAVHEAVHLIKSENAAAFDTLYNSVPSDLLSEEAVKEKIAEYEKSGIKLSDEAAREEIVAEFIGDAIANADRKTLHKIIGDRRSVGEVLLDIIDRLINAFKGIKGNDELISAYKKARQAIVDALSKLDKGAEDNSELGNDLSAASTKRGGKEDDVKHAVSDEYADKFDSWVNAGMKDSNERFEIGTTSEALQSIGMKEQKIILTSGTVIQKLKKHAEMNTDIFKKIPQLLEEPIIIQFSDAISHETGKPKYDSRITVMGELYAKVNEKGNTVEKPVLVSLELLPTNQKKNVILDFSIITSAYAKNTLQNYINNNTILYINPDKKRTNDWLSLNRLQLPLGENRYGSVNRITYDDEKVKIKNDADIRYAVSDEAESEAEEKGKYLPKGEAPYRDIDILAKTEAGKTSRFVRTAAESEFTTEEAAKNLQKAVEEGAAAYDVYTDRKAVEDANRWFEGLGGNLEKAAKNVENLIKVGGLVSKEAFAIAQLTYNKLIDAAVEAGDTPRATELLQRAENMIIDVSLAGTKAGQTVQAMRLIKRLSPEGQLTVLKKAVDDLNDKKKPDKKEAKKKTRRQELKERKRVLAGESTEKQKLAIIEILKKRDTAEAREALKKIFEAEKNAELTPHPMSFSGTENGKRADRGGEPHGESRYGRKAEAGTVTNRSLREEPAGAAEKNEKTEAVKRVFGIKNINDYINVQRKVFETLMNEGFFTDEGGRSRTVTNKESGLEIEINKSSIDETFSSGNKFKNLGKERKYLKLATIQNIAELIENAHLTSDSDKNYHAEKSGVKYAYLEAETTVDGIPVTVVMDIRKSPKKNKFWVHQVFTKKDAKVVPTGASSKMGLMNLSVKDNISQNDEFIKHAVSDEDKKGEISRYELMSEEELFSLYGELLKADEAREAEISKIDKELSELSRPGEKEQRNKQKTEAVKRGKRRAEEGVSRAREKLKAANRERIRLESEILDLKSEEEALAKEANAARAEKNAIKKAEARLAKKAERLKGLADERLRLEGELAELAADEEALKKEIAAERALKRADKRAIKNTEERIAKKTEKLKELADERLRLEGELAELAADEDVLNREIEATRAEIRELKKEEKKIKHKLEKLKDLTTKAQEAHRSFLAAQKELDVAKAAREAIDEYARIVEEENAGEKLYIPEDVKTAILKSRDAEELDAAMETAAKVLAEQMPTRFMGRRWREAWRYLAMLLNPTTHERNILSNTAMYLTVGMKDIVSGAMSDVYFGAKENKSTYGIPEYRENSLIRRFGEENRGETKQWIKNVVWKREKDSVVTGGMGKGKDYYLSEIMKQIKPFKTKVLNKINDFNSNLLEREDVLFLKANFTRAFMHYMTANNLSMMDVELNKGLYDEAVRVAAKEAREATFRDVSKLANAIRKLNNKHPYAGEFMFGGNLPFTRTPFNIVKRGVEYSPLGIGKTVYKKAKDSFKHEYSYADTDFINDMAKGMTGSAIFGIGMLMYGLGTVFIGKVDSDDEDKYRKERGEQNFSIKIGDYTYTIDWMQPSCIPFLSGAALMKLLTEQAESDEDMSIAGALSIVTSVLEQTFEPLTQTSILSSFSDALGTIRDADNDSETMVNFFRQTFYSYAGQYVPAVSAKIARTVDPYERRYNYVQSDSPFPETEYFLRKTASKVPFLSGINPPYVDMFGQEAKKKEGFGDYAKSFFENMLSPGYIKKLETDETDEEIIRLSKTAEASGLDVLNSAPPKTVKIKKGDVTKKLSLTAEEYSEIKKLSGESGTKAIRALVESDAYKAMSDKARSEAADFIWDVCYSQAVSEVIPNYHADKDAMIAKSLTDDPKSLASYAAAMAISALSDEAEAYEYTPEEKEEIDEFTDEMFLSLMGESKGYIEGYDAEEKTDVASVLYSYANARAKSEVLDDFELTGTNKKLYSIEEKTDISPAAYISFEKYKKEADSDKNGSYTQAEITEALRLFALENGASEKDLAFLWQMETDGLTKNNPYAAYLDPKYKKTSGKEKKTWER